MKRRTLLVVAGGLVISLAAAGCGEQKVSHPPAAEVLAPSSPDKAQPNRANTTDEPLVASGATVNVGLDEFEHFLRQHPELDKPQALDRLIERKLLVDEALERGLHADESLSRVRKRAMVRELLRARVEDEVTEDDITDDELAGAVEQVRREVGHPPGVRASHLVVLVPPEKQKKASNAQIEAWFEQSRTWLERLRAELPDDASAFDLIEVQRAFEDKVPAPLTVSVNAHLVFPVAETEEFGGDLPQTWHTVVPEFRDAAAELARQARYGELSEPVKTEFGWHVIVAEEAISGRVADEDAVGEVARWRLLRHKRNARFSKLMNEWAADAEMQTFPEVISEAEKLNN